MRPHRVLLMLTLMTAVGIYGYVFARKEVARAIEVRVKQAYPELAPSAPAPSAQPLPEAHLPFGDFKLPTASPLPDDSSDSAAIRPAVPAGPQVVEAAPPVPPAPPVTRTRRAPARKPTLQASRPQVPAEPEPPQAAAPAPSAPPQDAEVPVISLPPDQGAAQPPVPPAPEPPANDAPAPASGTEP